MWSLQIPIVLLVCYLVFGDSMLRTKELHLALWRMRPSWPGSLIRNNYFWCRCDFKDQIVHLSISLPLQQAYTRPRYLPYQLGSVVNRLSLSPNFVYLFQLYNFAFGTVKSAQNSLVLDPIRDYSFSRFFVISCSLRWFPVPTILIQLTTQIKLIYIVLIAVL